MGEYVCVTSSFLFTSYYNNTATSSTFRIRLATDTFSCFTKIESTPIFDASICEIAASRLKTEAGENEIEASSYEIEAGENEIEASSCETEAGENETEASI